MRGRLPTYDRNEYYRRSNGGIRIGDLRAGRRTVRYQFFKSSAGPGPRLRFTGDFRDADGDSATWLIHKYTEALYANMEGVLYRHGMARHYKYSSPNYRKLCQIDNEPNCEMNVKRIILLFGLAK